MRDFDLREGTAYEVLYECLLQRILYLLHNNPDTLWNILYRVDVDEKKVKQLFAQPDALKIAPELTQLVLDRIKQKAATRVLYKQAP